MGIRPSRVANEIREVVSTIIQEELKDPRLGFITITRAEITPDLRNAKIYFSCLGDERQKDSALEGLNSAAGYIRKSLGQKMRFKFAPELLFRLDDSTEYVIHLNEIFAKIRKEKKEDEHS